MSNLSYLASSVHVSAHNGAPYKNIGNVTALKNFVLSFSLISLCPYNLCFSVPKDLVSPAFFSQCPEQTYHYLKLHFLDVQTVLLASWIDYQWYNIDSYFSFTSVDVQDLTFLCSNVYAKPLYHFFHLQNHYHQHQT